MGPNGGLRVESIWNKGGAEPFVIPKLGILCPGCNTESFQENLCVDLDCSKQRWECGDRTSHEFCSGEFALHTADGSSMGTQNIVYEFHPATKELLATHLSGENGATHIGILKVATLEYLLSDYMVGDREWWVYPTEDQIEPSKNRWLSSPNSTVPTLSG